MNEGDLVTVVREPQRPAVVYVGRLGVIEDAPLNGKALVQFILESGEPGGAAFLPVDSLKQTNDPMHEAMLARYRQSVAETERTLAEWRQKRRRDIEQVAKKYGMSVEQVLEITEAVIGDDAHVYY